MPLLLGTRDDPAREMPPLSPRPRTQEQAKRRRDVHRSKLNTSMTIDPTPTRLQKPIYEFYAGRPISSLTNSVHNSPKFAQMEIDDAVNDMRAAVRDATPRRHGDRQQLNSRDAPALKEAASAKVAAVDRQRQHFVFSVLLPDLYFAAPLRPTDQVNPLELLVSGHRNDNAAHVAPLAASPMLAPVLAPAPMLAPPSSPRPPSWSTRRVRRTFAGTDPFHASASSVPSPQQERCPSAEPPSMPRASASRDALKLRKPTLPTPSRMALSLDLELDELATVEPTAVAPNSVRATMR